MPYVQKDKLGEIVTSRDLNEQKLVAGSIYASVFKCRQYLARTGYHQCLTDVSEIRIRFDLEDWFDKSGEAAVDLRYAWKDIVSYYKRIFCINSVAV